MTALRWGSATDTGLVRTINQDNLLASATLFAVADGMGGHVAGEIASEVAINALRRAFETAFEADGAGVPTGDDLVAAVHEANDAVYTRAQGDASLRGMGTTMTAAALVEEDGESRLAIANVGDSRGYVFTHSELTQLTEDHSVAEELVRQGQLDPSEVDTHPQRHILTRAMGIQPDVDVDLWEILPLVGDRLLLCSDGLVREVSDDQIASVLRRLADPTEAATELVARARAGGGSDNISVVIVDVVDDDDLALAASKAVHDDQAIHDDVDASGPAKTTLTSPRVGDVEGDDLRSTASFAAATFPKGRRRRWLTTLRVILFVLLVGGVVGGAGAAVVAYARGSYFVTFGPPPRPGTPSSTPAALDEPGALPLLVYQGRPGGLLWFKPTLAQRSAFTSAEVCQSHKVELAKGKIVPSLAAATRYIDGLVREAAQDCPLKPLPPSRATTTTNVVRVPRTTTGP